MNLSDVKIGDKLIIKTLHGALMEVMEVYDITLTQCSGRGYTTHRRYVVMLKTGKVVSRDCRAHVATPEQVADALAEFKRRDDRRKEQEERDAQAAYDALPESIKLARYVGSFFDRSNDTTIASLGEDVLRRIKDEITAKFDKEEHNDKWTMKKERA